ncbi:hypothetical protein [Thalassospira xiamenensis]|uniref:hypothetical protein n=1 Tax=Thalassospira xiamenensis TaxID=220697 RepID=UPI000BE2B9D4|nr:hypothetical protein [Thalassospira xiamenensis]
MSDGEIDKQRMDAFFDSVVRSDTENDNRSETGIALKFLTRVNAKSEAMSDKEVIKTRSNGTMLIRRCTHIRPGPELCQG